MQIIHFTRCVDIVGEVKYNELLADFAGGNIFVDKGQNEVRMQRRKIKIPAHKVAAIHQKRVMRETRLPKEF